MRVLAAVLAAGLSACASNASFIPRPADGYAALKVRETILLKLGALSGDLVLPAGTVLVGDRRMPSGEQLFCGDAGAYDATFGMSARKSHMCFAKRGGVLAIMPDRSPGVVSESAIPTGSIEEFRLR